MALVCLEPPQAVPPAHACPPGAPRWQGPRRTLPAAAGASAELRAASLRPGSEPPLPPAGGELQDRALHLPARLGGCLHCDHSHQDRQVGPRAVVLGTSGPPTPSPQPAPPSPALPILAEAGSRHTCLMTACLSARGAGETRVHLVHSWAGVWLAFWTGTGRMTTVRSPAGAPFTARRHWGSFSRRYVWGV